MWIKIEQIKKRQLHPTYLGLFHWLMHSGCLITSLNMNNHNLLPPLLVLQFLKYDEREFLDHDSNTGCVNTHNKLNASKAMIEIW